MPRVFLFKPRGEKNHLEVLFLNLEVILSPRGLKKNLDAPRVTVPLESKIWSFFLNALFLKFFGDKSRNKDFLTLLFHLGIVNLSNFRNPKGFDQEKTNLEMN